MKRINWEDSVKDWEKIDRDLTSGNFSGVIDVLEYGMRYCVEFLKPERYDPCRLCPLAEKGLCREDGDENGYRPFWVLYGLAWDMHFGDIPNTYGNRHKALMLCREILQGIYADMHDLED